MKLFRSRLQAQLPFTVLLLSFLGTSTTARRPPPLHLLFLLSSTPTPTPTPMSTATPFLPLLVLLPFLSSALPSPNSTSSSFSFARFDHTPSLSLLGDAHLSPPSTITMTTGAILHRDPLPFGRMPSFSSNLSFSISISPSGTSPLLAIVLSPDPNPSSHPGAFSVELRPLTSTPWKKLRSWVDFDGRRKLLEVRLSNAAVARPSEPALAYATDLTGAIWREQMFVWLRSSGGNSTRVVTVYDWSFEVRSAAPYRMHSEPLDPSALAKKPLEEQQQQQQQKPTTVGAGGKTRRRERDHGVLDVVVMVLMVGAACGAAVAFLVAFGWLGSVERRRIAPAERALPSLGFEYEKISPFAEKGSESAGGKVIVV